MTASPSSATAAPSTSPPSASSLMASGEVNLPPSSPTSSQTSSTSALPGFLCVTEKNLYWIRQHLAKYDGEKFSNVVKKKAVKMESVPQLEKYLKIMKNALPGKAFSNPILSRPFLSLTWFLVPSSKSNIHQLAGSVTIPVLQVRDIRVTLYKTGQWHVSIFTLSQPREDATAFLDVNIKAGKEFKEWCNQRENLPIIIGDENRKRKGKFNLLFP